jgi:RNA polymerase sigma-70 factor (ECF subfamily)
MNESAPPAAPSGTTPLSLLERARAKQPEAWRQLVDLYQPLVLFWCGRNGVPNADREDVAQEVFAGAAAGLTTFHRDQPGDTFRGWLRGIARNLCLAYFRRTRGEARAAGGGGLENIPAPAPGPDADEEAEIGRLYQRALDLVRGEFEPGTWEMFWLTVVEGRSPAALAAERGLTPAAVRQAKSRVLRRLKEEVGDVV